MRDERQAHVHGQWPRAGFSPKRETVPIERVPTGIRGDEWSETASIIRASYELGQLDEQLGDTAGSCAAYQKVIDRWGHATPRSVTGEAATKARARLPCPPQ